MPLPGGYEMNDVGLTEMAASALPTLATWLTGTGIACVTADPREPVGRHASRILHVSEKVYANHRDVVIDIGGSAPRLVRRGIGQPVEVSLSLIHI